MYTVTTEGYKRILLTSWKTKQPTMAYGGFGIGKSVIPKQVFEKIAQQKNKKFILWEKTTDKEKLDIIKNADDYFVFCDQRICTMDPTELRGIPNMLNTDMLTTIPYSWVIYFTQKNAHGVIFFDEINLATPVVVGSAYQIINDRTISDRKLGDDVFCMAAGNRLCDNAHVFDMPDPLKDRLIEFEVNCDHKEWSIWATQNNINPHLISFINWKPSRLYMVNTNGTDKHTTPRGIERSSELIQDLDVTNNNDLSIIVELLSVRVGVTFANEFRAYIDCYTELQWDVLFKNPENVMTLSIDKLWAVTGGLLEKYKAEPNNKKLFDDILTLILNMSAEYSVITLRLIKNFDVELFVNNINKSKLGDQIAKKYTKLLRD